VAEVLLWQRRGFACGRRWMWHSDSSWEIVSCFKITCFALGLFSRVADCRSVSLSTNQLSHIVACAVMNAKRHNVADWAWQCHCCNVSCRYAYAVCLARQAGR
jgi:hypothetical protein